MSQKTSFSLPTKILAVVCVVASSAAIPATWQRIGAEEGRYIEIDRESVVPGPDDTLNARGRIVLNRAVIDPKTSAFYNIIEIESRYDCARRIRTTLKRTYYKEDGLVLREEDATNSFELPIRNGTLDDILLRETCRSKSGSDPLPAPSLSGTLNQIDALATDLRKANETLIEQAVKEDRRRLSLPSTEPSASRPSAHPSRTGRQRTPSPPADARQERLAHASSGVAAPNVRPSSQAWTYEGATGPAHWGKLRPDYARCATGHRQSPIDLRDAFMVDLEPVLFFYRASSFRVADTARHLQLAVSGGGIQTLGKSYHITGVRFHNPSEFSIAGKFFDMEAQIIHHASDGSLAIVSVLLEEGSENPVVQAALNDMPLEKGETYEPAGRDIDIEQLLPADRRYFTFMGSLTTPPCTEDVLWIVIKTPQQVSAEQIAMFRRLYPPNARPAQPSFGRIIKESR
ncbi:MAG: carbonic anhydrase family protein [Candidatus Accumulibacter sp.]|jgi:carbonic anhydrase|nr:carbonic anhydrase family protein [Accumulibacter sp.]